MALILLRLAAGHNYEQLMGYCDPRTGEKFALGKLSFKECMTACQNRAGCTAFARANSKKSGWCRTYTIELETMKGGNGDTGKVCWVQKPKEGGDSTTTAPMKRSTSTAPMAKAPSSEPTSEPTPESTVLEPTAEPTEGGGSGRGSGRGSGGGTGGDSTTTAPMASTTSTMPASDTVIIEWVKSDGACRDVHKDTGKRNVNTGHRFHRVANLAACKEKCAMDDGCHGIASPHVTSARHDRTWCETYALKDGKGDGNPKFDCYMKPEFAASTTTHRSMGVGRHHRHRSKRRHRGGNKK